MRSSGVSFGTAPLPLATLLLGRLGLQPVVLLVIARRHPHPNTRYLLAWHLCVVRVATLQFSASTVLTSHPCCRLPIFDPPPCWPPASPADDGERHLAGEHPRVPSKPGRAANKPRALGLLVCCCSRLPGAASSAAGTLSALPLVLVTDNGHVLGDPCQQHALHRGCAGGHGHGGVGAQRRQLERANQQLPLPGGEARGVGPGKAGSPIVRSAGRRALPCPQPGMHPARLVGGLIGQNARGCRQGRRLLAARAGPRRRLCRRPWRHRLLLQEHRGRSLPTARCRACPPLLSPGSSRPS